MEPSARIVLELDDSGGRFEGRLVAEDGAPRPFSGWLEFVSVLDRWREDVGALDGEAARPVRRGRRGPRPGLPRAAELRALQRMPREPEPRATEAQPPPAG
jgi:hypothetical protein